MTRRRWLVVAVALAGAAVLAIGVTHRDAADPDGAVGSDPRPGSAAQASLAGDRAPGRSRASLSSAYAHRQHKDARNPDGTVDIERVKAALARANETAERISREQIVEEQKRME